MPSNKYPSVVSPGTGLPVSTTASTAAIGEALRAHINDAVGAHAASAISYTAGPNWYDGDTNPDSDVQTEIDKILADLTAAAGGPVVDGAGKIGWYAGNTWVDGTPNPTTSVGLQLRKIIDDLATQTPPSGATKIGTSALAVSFTNAPHNSLAGSVTSQLTDLILFANTPYRTVLLDAGTPTYAISAAPRVSTFLVDASAAGRRIDMPASPSDHKGWRWYVIDTAGSSARYNITLRSGIPTINGFSGDLLVGKDHGQWVITCDGTNFSVEEIQLPKVPVGVSGGNSPYTVDSNGAQNDLIFVRTSGARTIIFPAASTCKGRVWHIVDDYGASHIFNITLQPNGGDTINSYSGSITVGKSFGHWVVTCNGGTDLLVQEVKPPTMQPPVVTTTPYDLDAGSLQYEDVYVDTTAIPIAVILPQYPSSHKNQKWFVYDYAGTSATNNITFQRYGGTTYQINGRAGDLVVKGNFYQWVITCDGTNFSVQEVAVPVGDYRGVNSISTPYTLDSDGYRNDLVGVTTNLLLAGNRIVVLPAVPASYKGRRWHIYDVSTAGSTERITLQRGGAYTINGVAGDLIVKLAGTVKDFGHWLVTCDGSNFWVHEIPPQTGGLSWSNIWTNTNDFQDQITILGNHYIDFGATNGSAGLNQPRRSGVGTFPGIGLTFIAQQGQAPTGPGFINNNGGPIRFYPGGPSTEGIAGTGQAGDFLVTWFNGLGPDSYERHITSRDLTIVIAGAGEKVILAVPFDTKLMISCEVWIQLTASGAGRIFAAHLDYAGARQSGGLITEDIPAYFVVSQFDNGSSITAPKVEGTGVGTYEVKVNFGATGTFQGKVFIIERGNYFTWSI